MRLTILPLVAMACSLGSSPAARSLEALRLEPPFGVPAGVARQWDSRLKEVHRHFSERRYGSMLESLRQPLIWAAQYKPNKFSLRTLTFASAAHIARLDYPAALAVLFETQRQCRQIQDGECTAAVETNLSSLYFKIRAMPEALDAAEHALAARHNLRNGENRARMLIHKARLLSRQGHTEEANTLLRDVSVTAEQSGFTRVAAESWESGGLERLFGGDLRGAEFGLRNAFRLRWTSRDPALPVSQRNLGLLRLRQQDVAAALEFASKNGVASLAPDWTVAQMRARAYAAMGDYRKALSEYSAALDLVTRFHLDGVPPALRSSAADRNRELYDELIGAAWRLHRASPDPELVPFMLAAASSSQALSLRPTTPAPGSAPGYWPALAGLQASYAGMMEKEAGSARDLAKLRRRLIEIQAATEFSGTGRSWHPDKRAVRSWQQRLDQSALLVFHVTDSGSYLWPVTRDSASACELPPRARLAELVGGFRAEIEAGTGRGPRGAELSSTILSCLPPQVRESPRWMIVPDGPLFDLPFAALPEPDTASATFLVERRSLRILPGTWLFGEDPRPAWNGPLLGIADPIYNSADPRLRRGIGAGPIHPQLPRLPAGSTEVSRCARALGMRETLLTGSGVTAESVGQALRMRPSIIHFATHVLPSPVEAREGLIALSVPPRGPLEYLSTEWIAAQELRPELVVMSACRSGSGTIRPGDGLMGLTRAWLQAGAGSVIATYWPTPDDPGSLLESFYKFWRSSSASDQDESFRQAQLAAIRTGGWQAKPAFWAGFFLIGRPSPALTASIPPSKEIGYPPKTN